ncbi:MAG: transglycosylase domain-containing protein [Dehalococcoidia bacterium]
MPRRTKPGGNHQWLILAGVGVAMMASILAAATVGTALAYYRHITGEFPPLAEKIAIRGSGITTVVDRNGQPLGVLSNPNSAIAEPVQLDEVSPYLIEATISTEDNNFWAHEGFDPKGVLRAAWSTYVEGHSTTGGSTITQQLVKTVYFTTDCEEFAGVEQCTAPRTLTRKLKELALAIDTDERYTKDQILTWYLNSISYGGRYVGIEAAAKGYFDKPASELTLAEAAVLAGLPSAPTLYSPRANCVLAESSENCAVDELGRTILAGDSKVRQEYVLDLMVEHGRVTAAEAEKAKSETIHVYNNATENRAAAFIEDQVEPRLVRMCRAGLLPRTEGSQDCVESVHSGGYTVTTTLDWNLNTQASDLLHTYVNQGLASGCECHNGSIVTIEPTTGQVVVYVPNIDPTWVSDPRVAGNIDQAVEIHQPGSSFKPAVYLTWMDKLNKTPVSSIWDTNPLELIDKPKKPEDQVTIQNPGVAGSSQGLITARAALGGSQNVPAFRAAEEVGPDNVIATAKALGITTLDQRFDPTFRDHGSVIYGPSLATGGANIRVIDMAYMESTIANMGMMVGVPTLASTVEVDQMVSLDGSDGERRGEALNQRDAFIHGHIRLPGTRQLDPVVVLKVTAADGSVLYEHGDDLQKVQVVNPGSVWMLHSIMSDCTARFLIWQCGQNNDDLSLDVFANGVKVPGGVKTGTQQGALSAKDTLETWLTGYSRYAGTAVWIGNADKSIVRDGPSANYISANTTLHIYKHWMGAYHEYLASLGAFKQPAGFDDLQPSNVKYDYFQSASTERGRAGGCYTKVKGWQRTDVDYHGGDCLGKSCFELPTFKKDAAVKLAYSRGIQACGVYIAPSPTPTEEGIPGAGTPAHGTPAPKKTPTAPGRQHEPPATVTAAPANPAPEHTKEPAPQGPHDQPKPEKPKKPGH